MPGLLRVTNIGWGAGHPLLLASRVATPEEFRRAEPAGSLTAHAHGRPAGPGGEDPPRVFVQVLQAGRAPREAAGWGPLASSAWDPVPILLLSPGYLGEANREHPGH